MLALKSCWACLSGRKFVLDQSPPKDVVDLFKKYSERDVMRAEHLQKFLLEVQGEQISETEAEALVIHLLDEKGSVWDKLSKPKLNLETFFNYLFDVTKNLPITTEVHHDMNQPMSHYFIYTGHNSYLTGNQLSSDCSEKPLIVALKQGVRVIELDLWPNSSKDGINVLHGRTLTTPVDFEKCILAIRDNAFSSSEYPVVITFEDHLPATLQAKAAEIVHAILGETLYYPELGQEFPEFPSPESLKKRIIISTKPPKEYLANTDAPNQTAAEGTEEAEQIAWGDELPDISEDSSTKEKNLPVSAELTPELESSDEESKPPEKRDDSKVAPEYKRIITIRAGKPKGSSLKDALANSDNARRVSLSEPQLSKAVSSHPTVVISFTKKNLLRVYPKGSRVDSSNYNPLKSWAHGAQMVAFNMQGYGRPLWLVHGLFRANGGCGYVKKPDFLINGNSENGEVTFDPANPGPVKKVLKVKVYQGKGWLQKFSKTHFDRFSPPDFYTRVGIAGVKADTIMKNTQTKMDNWIPRWEEEFEFPLRVPELALLRIEVHEYDAAGRDDFGGQTCLPVQELKAGIHAVPLYDKKGKDLSPVRLLMHFSL
ncbi:hypothetical protein KP509_33G046900 [Ceratopteris richardii]|uniref:Phosphoinositide phospholipase C n=1 Tax=Ceratopteris richardii TaxID=49495 RepID=A0A8T2QQB5_CERRI|nr:hypothetical protein KP509_33G046900 [Ceratopteris richardii]KAH7285807.1 hypothetical protein KP509_33G046900 [Ceratopteris richardii]KAH7285808.1 hypothetical protein KP509_33G046900 [Ceratopteris richardii]KAH7285809.1 hypothetical protein KP509_33G046900 [Ceratopteris richardii]KAH7285810.1 hypothetical protein KP509_33G046900 [Ceratopteris richardii]